MQESEWLPTLFESLTRQDFKNLELVACVNQPDSYHRIPEKQHIIDDNQRCLQMLEAFGRSGMKVHLIDHSSKGKGWPEHASGVGQARKAVMDYIAALGLPDELIVSIDADTFYPPEYFAVIEETYKKYPEITGLCLPYHHPLNNDEEADRCILRYELYMRAYALNLLLINNPYAFTALGSAMATKIKVYRRLKGLTPFTAGEDFYFIQKLIKNGPVATWAPTQAYPAGRFSDRVIFGTGPAMIKGHRGNWASYPIYPPSIFIPIRQTFESFESLFKSDLPTPLDDFLEKTFKTRSIWQPLRANACSVHTFMRACMQKIDGLRILQYCKTAQADLKISIETALNDLLALLPGGEFHYLREPFSSLSIQTLNTIRMFLEESEYLIRKASPFVNQKYFQK